MSVNLFAVVREYFPNATDDECGFLIWNRTPYPMGRLENIRECLANFKSARDVGKYPCDICESFVDQPDSICDTCREKYPVKEAA
jgi:hypothetical protein